MDTDSTSNGLPVKENGVPTVEESITVAKELKDAAKPPTPEDSSEHPMDVDENTGNGVSHNKCDEQSDDITMIDDKEDNVVNSDVVVLEITDKGTVDSEKNKVGSEKDKMDSEKDKVGSEKDKVGSEKDKVDSEKDKVDSEKDIVDSEKDIVGSEKDKVGSEKDIVGSEKDIVGSEKDMVGSAKDKVGSAKDKVCSAKDKVGSAKDKVASARDMVGSDEPGSSETGKSSKEGEVPDVVDLESAAVSKQLDNSPKASPEFIGADDESISAKPHSPTDANKQNAEKKKDEEKKKSDVVPKSSDVQSSSKDSSSKSSESKKEGRKEGESGKKKKGKTCPECGLKKKLRIRIVFQGKSHQMCSEDCYKNFKQKMVSAKIPVIPKDQKCGHCHTKIEPEQGFFPIIGEIKPLCSEECLKKHHVENANSKTCSQCKKVIEKLSDLLAWETMNFCNEECLGKYQSHSGSHCTCCQTPVPQASLGKYCVCFGADIRQFCSGSCLEEFKKGLKVCSFCQTDLSAGTDGFLAPVGEKGQFKDFCSQQCMERYEVMNNLSKNAPESLECAHCKKQGTFKTQVTVHNKQFALCCDLCVAAFRYTYQIKDNMCNTCFKFFELKDKENFSFYYENLPRHFCTKACLTLYVLAHRKIIQCVQCKVKKYTFDMIEKMDSGNSQVYCSLNCLSQFRRGGVSLKMIKCDQCSKNAPAQYHLTMSDSSLRNFCTYQCVLNFQNQYMSVSNTPSGTPRPALKAATITTSSSPVIAKVVSLAQPRFSASVTTDKNVLTPLMSIRPQQPLNILTQKNQLNTSTISVASPSAATSSNVIREVVIRPPPPKSVKNKAASCKPIMLTKGVNARSSTCHKAVQTDDRPMPIILPIPVPVYIPTPVPMCFHHKPCPVPFPIPMPVPIILNPPIKRRRDSAPDIYDTPNETGKPTNKEVKVITTPQSPMIKPTESPSDKETTLTDEVVDLLTVKSDPIMSLSDHTPSLSDEIQTLSDEVLTLSDDVLCKEIPSLSDVVSAEATMSGEGVDSTLPFESENAVHLESQPSSSVLNNTAIAESPKPSASAKRKPTEDIVRENKKVKVTDATANNNGENDSHLVHEVFGKFDEGTDTKLKFTPGINAWVKWASMMNPAKDCKLKNFRRDIHLMCTEDINYALSIFLQHMRQVGGDGFSAGALYYLCLSIQLYLSEHGRSDNIFSDDSYELFINTFHTIMVELENKSLRHERPISRISEEYLWESGQLGAHSPEVLLNTMIFLNTKYFTMSLKEHRKLLFADLLKNTKKKEDGRLENYLSYYCPYIRGDEVVDDNKELPQNYSNRLRCPVKYYDFYTARCPPELIFSNTKFYLEPAKKCLANGTWYLPKPMNREVMSKVLQRYKFIEELCQQTYTH